MNDPTSLLTVQLRAFAAHPETDQTILLSNRNGQSVEFLFRRMKPDSVSELMAFQTDVVSRIPGCAETNVFQSLSRVEYEYSILHDICVGVYRDAQLAAVLVLLPHPTPEQNLMLDLPEYRHIPADDILVVDMVLVGESCRGFGLQRTFNHLADCFCREMGIHYECTTVSPLNVHSLRNTMASGFRLVGNFKKYQSTRNFFVKEL